MLENNNDATNNNDETIKMSVADFDAVTKELKDQQTRNDFLREQLGKLNTKIEKVQAYLVEGVEDRTIDEDVAEWIADLLDIELEQTTTITLKIEVEVKNKIGFREALVESDLNIVIEPSWSGGDIQSVEDFQIVDFTVN
jgi:septal ring factor EnvC (AmiA/AmiB activator)